MNQQDVFNKGLADPVWFIRNVVGYDLWSKQQEIVRSVRDNKFTAVRSCNGAGKSFVSASVVAWALGCHYESIVLTTAPTTRQVEEILWQEIARLHAKSKFPLGGELLKTKWTMGPKWFAMGLSTNDPSRFQGFHAPFILVIMDEACGVGSEIYEAVSAVTVSDDAHVLLIGNPTDPNTEFHKAFQSPLYNKIHISAFDTPEFTGELGDRRIPGLITKEWAEQRKAEWGENSPAYLARVLGDFPDSSSAAMIPLSWIMRATESAYDNAKAPRTMGVDVGRFGDDPSAIACRVGNATTLIRTFNKLDTVEVADEVEKVYLDTGGYEVIAVDAVGVGGGVADILRRRGYPAVDIESGERAYMTTRFNNRRTEMWFRLRELMRTQSISLPEDDRMIGELSAPKYSFDLSGRYRLETKEEMKRRGLSSPNIADAVVYAYAYDGKYRSSVMLDEANKKYKANTYQALLNDLIRQQQKESIW